MAQCESEGQRGQQRHGSADLVASCGRSGVTTETEAVDIEL